jgi:DNA-binding NtrC family response regulator
MKGKQQARILVIDDEESVRKSLAFILEDEGYMVDVAENGQEAIRKSKANLYNLALVDIRLPDMDGISLLPQMREIVPKMVKIVVTGYPSLDNSMGAVNNGANGYIIKPYSVENLLHTIREHSQKQQEAEKFDEKKVVDFIETRDKENEARISAAKRPKN